ncbi:cyclase family protein [Deinococcus pimensis]|uniref:cyclase family protein n=1 Tax=Deinococcus pimensis TaxID=309888 RepID=UPI0004AEA23E|nr:cyclase family protein [Deinococcus pimensis]
MTTVPAPLPGVRAVYDLSVPLYHNCPAWPDYDPALVSRDYQAAFHGFNAETVRMNTHTGTHVDAPFHFFDEGRTIDQVPLDAWMGPALFIDLRHKLADEPITEADLAPSLGALDEGDFAVLVTGWVSRRGVNRDYLTRWPYLTGEGARALIDAGVKGVGIDTLSIGGYGGPEKGRPPHEVILGAGRVIVEELDVPEHFLDGRKRVLCAAPILLRGCGGAWARAFAFD